MTDRITVRDLEARVERINRALNDDPTPVLWERVNGHLVQQPGVYHLDGAYGGWALYRTCDPDANGESHGINDVSRIGHAPKRELATWLDGFLDGLDARA